MFGGMLPGDDQDLPADPLQALQQQDELGNAGILQFQIPQQPMTAARCINGDLVRPDNTDEEPPSTACRQSTVIASGGVQLGRGPAAQHSPGGLRGRHVPPPPPPPPPPPAVPHATAAKAAGGGGPPNVHPTIQAAAVVQEQIVNPVKVIIHIQEEEQQDPMAQEEEHLLLPKLMVPSNYKACSMLDMRQILESWYDKSTFAIATWRGDAQRYWLTQVLDCARNRHDQWLQSSPSQRASLEPAYILGDRKHIPEAQNAVESVLRTELLDAIPRSIADACMRHGYCTAELIVWYVMKQLILPHDINEVTMQKEILTHPMCMARGDATSIESMYKDEPAGASKDNHNIRAGSSKWHHTVPSSTIVRWAMSGTVSTSSTSCENLTLERVYAMLAEFLIELKLHEEQDKIAQLVTGSSSTVKHSAYEYINASKGKCPIKAKGKQGDGKGAKSKWRPACEDYWKPGGCSQGHNCPRYHPRRQPGRCAICGSTKHATSQCSRPVKPKVKNAEWDEPTWSYEEEEWPDYQWESEEYEASKSKKGKGKGSKAKGKSKGKSAPRLIAPKPTQSSPTR